MSRKARCRAVLNVAGQQYLCDVEHTQPGLAHGNEEAEASWCSAGEAKKYANPPLAQRVSAP